MIDKLFNAIGYIVVVGSWFLIMIIMLTIDATQIDSWLLGEIGFFTYLTISMMFFALMWFGSKLAKHNEGEEGNGTDLDFD